MLFDSHAHAHFNAYKNDSDAVIRRALVSPQGKVNALNFSIMSKFYTNLSENFKVNIQYDILIFDF
ncbi:hypothetical protein A3H10_03235 [Candidatus Uhrbacteria bacterium RIFCSPLOWO2_12_FULL_46_10]|uniref:Uncharacterized protein n=1 Tax=Candidatus Uhrbacteria bacterium RIFCSPLOWO2_01_FULL_47_25 TaxID=1802402 RepID=A0A1F7UWV2_9BACT|nr:MAG: hypothetical protein A2752_03890 [Candidatus Uhrbacteria bacterium RIFCSPHIGHO2_01_FULL_46_23]OGL69570.1 MAG: hypothetical protein A3D60_00180 [Candidatus Uhrbacteria bacterium RIFCSPHIGHO2_02_FULL_47_29]OGL76608.1 MAG: hypothetical protein A3E96_00480 [Candidatus Uhrbacteria bacterium RIFCSPHIGHO2_12_FULL_46_13]OGL82770.1 MAG: hypothetical protein A2936_05545 [Candidatus Uhrbacteria bacterium RIFCSPLOWO2_01_FULL_47_25]OGL85180.1 MAG: hypothetical protein A3I37_01495 [Candidatus Uhrbact